MINRPEKPISILAVDDDAVVLQLISKHLASVGYVLHTARGGEEALKELSENSIDVIVSDVKMPGINGLDLLKMVKEKYPGVGFIIMTAFGDLCTVKEAMLLGADEYLPKPFKTIELSMIVERTYWRILASREVGV